MKKTISFLLTLVMALNLMVFAASAAEGGVSIAVTNNESPKILQVTANVDGAQSYEYQWVQRSSTGESYTDIITDTSDTYIVTPRDKNMYINCRVTPVYSDGTKGEPVYAPADYQVTKIGRANRSSAATTPFPQKSPPENLFTVEGQTRKYILLDQFVNEEAAFYIMQDKVYGKMLFDT